MDREQIIVYIAVLIMGIIIALICTKVTEWTSSRRTLVGDILGFLTKLVISIAPLFGLYYLCMEIEITSQGPMITLAVLIAIFQMAFVKFRKDG